MRITIELEGKPVEVIDVAPSGAAASPSMNAEPPAEVLAAARAIGAQSAGFAAFTLPPSASVPLSTIDVTEQAVLPDVDAGSAAGVATAIKRRAKKAGAKVAKRGK